MLNNTRCRATGFTPNHLHIGLKPDQAYPDIFNTLCDSPPSSRSKFIEDRVKEIEIARDLAFRNQEHYFHTSDQQWKKNNISPLRDHDFTPGEFVLVKRLGRSGQNIPKLPGIPAYLGPAMVKKLVGKKAVVVEYIANGQIRIRNYKHLVHFHEPEGKIAQSQQEYQKYYNGPGDRSEKDKNKHLYHRILDNDDDERDDYNEKRIDFMTDSKINLKDFTKTFLASDVEDQDAIHDIDDQPHDEFEDEYHELMENIDLVNPYSEDEQEDPRQKRDLAGELAKMFHPQSEKTVAVEDEPKRVLIDETMNKVLEFENEEQENDNAEEDTPQNLHDHFGNNDIVDLQNTGPQTDTENSRRSTRTKKVPLKYQNYQLNL